ncbi:MAG: hypothetical protein WD873_01440 [Candidatus Hydrogenedentales bacterium]
MHRGTKHRGAALKIAIAVILVLGAAALAGRPVIARMRARNLAEECAINLANLEHAKIKLKLRRGLLNNDPISIDDLISVSPELVPKAPVCPSEGTYAIGDHDTTPTCSLGGEHRIKKIGHSTYRNQ